MKPEDKTPKFIAVSGHFQSGKDSVGQMIVEELAKIGKHAQIIKFADGVREIAKTYFKWDGNKDADFTDDRTRDPAGWKNYIGGRTLLQGIGHSYRETAGKDFWIRQVERGMTEPDTLYVVTDLRYLNEAQWVRGTGGAIIKVHRDGFEGDSHPSETEMDTPELEELVNTRIYNNHSLDFLRDTTITMLEKHNLI